MNRWNRLGFPLLGALLAACNLLPWSGYAKHGDHASNDMSDRSFAEVLAQLATQRGTVENVKVDTGESDGPADLGRKRLCRYSLRPPFSLARFRVVRGVASPIR